MEETGEHCSAASPLSAALSCALHVSDLPSSGMQLTLDIALMHAATILFTFDTPHDHFLWPSF